MSNYEIVLLGTGGGRFVTVNQKRRTGGIHIISDVANMHIDPGPGALVYALKMGLRLTKIRAILVSHAHPDHCNDAEILIEAMTRATIVRRGILFAPPNVLMGSEFNEPSISKYHQTLLEKVIKARPSTSFSFNNLKIIATETKHSDPHAVGFRFEDSQIGDFAYTSDTEYFEGIGKYYEGVRLLLLCLMRPFGSPWRGHMTTDDAIKILKETNPEMAVITHFGMKMIFKGPASEAKLIQQKTGIPTIAATDGMRLKMGEKIQAQTGKRKVKGLDEFLRAT